MKTTKMWFVVMAAMIMNSVMFLTSCSNDDEPELPEVIESEVWDEGIDNNVQSQTNVAPDGTAIGTTLSYQSWIMVKGLTRAAFDNKVQVTLNGSLNNIEEVRPVNHWDVGQAETSISRSVNEQRREGFVTITDSVLVYTVQLAEFSFDYHLNYEVAVYDDGITRQVMPYYYYGKITDNGGVLETVDSYVDGSVAYARRIYHHSITVEFGGESHELKAEITLRRELGASGQPYILRSRIAGQSLSPCAENVFLASVDVNSVWSNGTEELQHYTAELPFISERHTGDEITIHGSKEDIVLEETLLERVTSSYEDGGECMTLERIEEKCVLRYNLFTLSIPLVRYEALFDNILLQERLGAYTYDAESIRVTGADWRLEEENENKAHYFLSLHVQIDIGEAVVEAVYDGWIVFIKG